MKGLSLHSALDSQMILSEMDSLDQSYFLGMLSTFQYKLN